MKFLNYIFLSLLILSLTACSQPQEEVPAVIEDIVETDARTDFFNNLHQLCGATFTGEASYPENDDHALVGTGLRTYVSECTDSMVRIELFRNDGEYWHGAWVLEQREEGLHLFHDHLGDARTMDDLGEGDYHGYGGFANLEGTATRQFFPADEVTAEIIPAAATNVWMMDLDFENEVFTYYLERHNEPRFRAELARAE